MFCSREAQAEPSKAQELGWARPAPPPFSNGETEAQGEGRGPLRTQASAGLADSQEPSPEVLAFCRKEVPRLLNASPGLSQERHRKGHTVLSRGRPRLTQPRDWPRQLHPHRGQNRGPETDRTQAARWRPDPRLPLTFWLRPHVYQESNTKAFSLVKIPTSWMSPRVARKTSLCRQRR